MMNKTVFALTLIATASYAQTQNPTLESAREFARSEVARLEKESAAMSGSTTLVPCDFYTLKIQQKYNEWFLEPAHYDEFVKLSNDIDSATAAVNKKLVSLADQTVSVLVSQGTNGTSSEVPVAFKDLVGFFKLYDQRMKNCPKDQQAALMEMMDSEPGSNPMGIVLSQIRAAGGIMSVNLNASLREPDAVYNVVITPSESGYKIELLVNLLVNGVNEPYRFSLVDGDVSTIKVELSPEEKWAVLSKGKIDNMPVDGLLRYREFQRLHRGKCNKLTYIPSKMYGTPYVKYEELPTVIAELKKRGVQLVVDVATFALIQPATFQMGSPETEKGRGQDEVLHSVTLSKEFEIQTTEVTQAQWYDLMKSNPSAFKEKKHCSDTWSDEIDKAGMCPNNPVERVSWNDVQTFLTKLNERDDGFVYRLPTEAEWEYAARGESAKKYFHSDNEEDLKDAAWYRKNSDSLTHAVGSAGGGAANEFGLYDMHGNVYEWVQDWYGAYGDQPLTDPQGAGRGSYRVCRGGSWDSDAPFARSAARSGERAEMVYRHLGFRIVRTIKQSTL